jgi:hypothetical protein
MSAKLARFRPAAFYLDCPIPHCGGGFTDPKSGSYLLEAFSVAAGDTQTCFTCGTQLVAPRMPWEVK